MLKLLDRIKQTSLTEGTNSIIFNNGTFASFQPFSVIGDGNSTYYTIENNQNFEVGVGTYNSSNNSLSRDIILDSSNNGQKINLIGLSIVFCTYPADRAVFLNDQGFILGQDGFYSGIKFPDGTVQSTSLIGSGDANKIAYWNSYNNLTYSDNLGWSNNTLSVTGSGIFSNNVNIGGNLIVAGSLSASNFNIANSTITSSVFIDNVFYRNSAGCFFHAYLDNLYDNMVALHSTNEQEPTWKLGLKSYSTSFSAAPTVGYISGKNGAAGVYTTDQNGLVINFTNGFWVKHRNIDIFNADKNNGISVYNATAAKDALRVIGAAAQASNLQTWETFTSNIVASISANGQLYCQSVKFSDNSIQTRAYIENARNISSNSNILSSDDVVLVDCSISNVNLTLPSAVNLAGKKLVIKRKTGNFSLTVLPSGSQTIDGQLSFSINNNYQSIKVVSDGSNWFII
jgi:hypothetical protein